MTQTDRLTEIEESLVEYETAWSDYEFGQTDFDHGFDSLKWLIAEVKRLRKRESSMPYDLLQDELHQHRATIALVHFRVNKLRAGLISATSFVEWWDTRTEHDKQGTERRKQWLANRRVSESI